LRIEDESPLIESNEGNRLSAGTDIFGETYSVQLKKKHTPANDEYTDPEKILVLSDIEGNFRALRRLLQGNEVIDSQFNWTFGKGHLVIAGDVFDRGDQVTECLWLIYSLEQKAAAAGGNVHFILGNHEIMCLTGDIRYASKKYIRNSKKLKTSYESLFSTDSELGKWLRSKNVIEKIGSRLFVHAGISQSVNDLPMSIREMNNLVRKQLTTPLKIIQAEKTALQVLFNSDTSPFWYRGYYKAQNESLPLHDIINDSLERFNVSMIITGHTITEDISMLHNGKVVNVDTHHRSGDSEALLIDKTRYFKVDPAGNKLLLYQASTPLSKK
jgi:hypothetical protein